MTYFDTILHPGYDPIKTGTEMEIVEFLKTHEDAWDRYDIYIGISNKVVSPTKYVEDHERALAAIKAAGIIGS